MEHRFADASSGESSGETFSFQARPLYEKLDYKVFGTLENHPKGHSQHY
ncbi:MAG: hypothetical protein WAU82_14185 [Candidatus Binatus sp.]